MGHMQSDRHRLEFHHTLLVNALQIHTALRFLLQQTSKSPNRSPSRHHRTLLGKCQNHASRTTWQSFPDALIKSSWTSSRQRQKLIVNPICSILATLHQTTFLSILSPAQNRTDEMTRSFLSDHRWSPNYLFPSAPLACIFQTQACSRFPDLRPSMTTTKVTDSSLRQLRNSLFYTNFSFNYSSVYFHFVLLSSSNVFFIPRFFHFCCVFSPTSIYNKIQFLIKTYKVKRRIFSRSIIFIFERCWMKT